MVKVSFTKKELENLILFLASHTSRVDKEQVKKTRVRMSKVYKGRYGSLYPEYD